MYILAFETSCDDTSVALMQDDRLIALSTRTQREHDTTGGVVPEVAARSHANAIFPCIEDVFSESGISLDAIEYIAVTQGPGLQPSLLTGLTVAKTLSLSLQKPLVLLDHIEGHIFANLLDRNIDDILFPAVVLTVSGGHTEIYLWKSLFELEMIGCTRDDAAGECFDKVAKIMGLGFPGGAKIAGLAQAHREKIATTNTEKGGISQERIFPEVLLEKDSLDFSFSGLKTAAKREIEKHIEQSTQGSRLTNESQEMIAYEIEETITDILSKKLMRALQHTQARMVCIAGGVSANSLLREKCEHLAEKAGVPCIAPKKILYSLDNAAMIGIRAYYEIVSQNRKQQSCQS